MPQRSENTCDVRLVRRSGFADRIRRYEIYVDQAYAGSLPHKGELDLKVPSGPVTLEARIDWCGSQPLKIEAAPNRRVEVEVANRWGALLALWAALFKRHDYLILRPIQHAGRQGAGKG